MRPFRKLSPLAAAFGLFTICLLLGAGVRWMVRVEADDGSTASAGPVVSVRSGVRSVHVRNLTDIRWSECVVTIEGGARSKPFGIAPQGSLRLGYRTFQPGDGGRPEGLFAFVHAFHQTAVSCRDSGGEWHPARIR